jgi:two-component system, NtrC family, sensor histidine kinase KinB
VTLGSRLLAAQAPLLLALTGAGWAAYRVAGGFPAVGSRELADQAEAASILAGALAVALGATATIRLTRRALRPLSILGQAARRLGQGDFEARAQLSGDDEIARLARDFNAMAARLGELQRSSVGELVRARQAAQAAIDSLPDPVLIFDLAGALKDANDAAEIRLGLRPGSEVSDLLEHTDPAVRAAIERIRSHVLSGRGAYLPSAFDQALRLPSPEGERSWLPRATPLYGPEGEVIGVTVVLQDVTRARRIEELRDDMVATVAHELKTPLTSLRMAVHLLVEEAAGPLSGPQADLLHAARQDCERIQGIIDDILDLARIQSGRVELRREPLQGEELVAAVVEGYLVSASEKAIELRAEALPGGPRIMGDRERLELVLRNLVSNALKHTPTGGRVAVRCLSEAEALRFEVEDCGEGIAPEYRARVFDRFFQIPGRRAGGSGLGLAIAREIVEAHGGTIGVDSEPGRGSRFWFRIPAPRSPRSAA